MTDQTTLERSAEPNRGLTILKTALYLLAGLILGLGLLTGIGVLAGAGSMVTNLILPLELMGLEAAVNLVKPVLNGLMVNLGIAALLVSLALSGLLFAVGRLIGYVQKLETRVAAIESSQGLLHFREGAGDR